MIISPMKHVRDKEKYNAYMREYNLKRYYRLKREAAEKLGGQCVNCRSEKIYNLIIG